MTPAHRSWQDLTPRRRRLTVLAAAAEIAITTWAGRDLARRPAESVRGPRAAWALGLLVQPVGPVAYLAWGRRPR
jgi:hypothetical protein